MSVIRRAMIAACAATVFALAFAALRWLVASGCLDHDGTWLATQWTCAGAGDYRPLPFAKTVCLALVAGVAAAAVATKLLRRRAI